MNSLRIDITGKVVVLSRKEFSGTESERMFLCEKGFGCSPFTSGSAVYGKFISDGEKCRVEGHQIEKLVGKINE